MKNCLLIRFSFFALMLTSQSVQSAFYPCPTMVAKAGEDICKWGQSTQNARYFNCKVEDANPREWDSLPVRANGATINDNSPNVHFTGEVRSYIEHPGTNYLGEWGCFYKATWIHQNTPIEIQFTNGDIETALKNPGCNIAAGGFTCP